MRKHKGLLSGAAAVVENTTEKAIEKPVESYVVVDFPMEKEVIASPHYTIRLGASHDAEKVELSIDGADFLACRHAVGYFWFDWSGYSKVAHKISARLTTKDGRIIYSDLRTFSVKLPKTAGAASSTKVSKTRKKLSRMLADINLSIA